MFGNSKHSKYLSTDETGVKSWAFITGASDGIGQGFAQELCSHGFNVLIHGRNSEKLARVQAQLKAEYPKVQVRSIVADAACVTPEIIEAVVKELKAEPSIANNLTVLINNIGGTGVLDANFKSFATHTATEIDGLINVNIRFTILLTHALLPLLTFDNHPSLIMNIGSQAHVGLPYMSIYSSTKGFVHAFTKALKTEFSSAGEDKPIEVLEIVVGSVQTQQNQTDHTSFFVPSSRTMAKSAWAKVGCGKVHVAGYWPHGLQQFSYKLVPGSIFDKTLLGMLKPLAGKTERRW